MKILKSFAFAVLAVAGAQSMNACDICAIYDATEAHGGLGSGLIGGVAEQFTHFGTLQDGGHKIGGHGEYIDSSISQLFVLYNINKRAGLQLNIPFIHREWGDNTGHAHTSGLGDISLVGHVALWEKFSENFSLNWNLMGGVKFPTGNSSLLALNDADLPTGIGGHDLALGSGSYDGLIGTTVFARYQRWFATANLQYAIRTRGDFGHRYANDFTWIGGPGYYVALKDAYTIAVQFNIAGETKGKDNFYGIPDEDSAATLVYLGPEVNFTWGNKLNVVLAADLPVHRDNTGEQVMPDYRIRAVASWKFW